VAKTGIKKRVLLHGFRHSRATHLSEHFTEQQMKNYLGWAPGSDMPAVYCHLSGKDIDKAVKTMYGIEDIETPVDPMKPGKCSRCGEMNASGANYCYKCGLPLTQSAYQEEQTATVTGEEILQQWIKSNPEKMVKILQGLGEKQ
jgi:integrase/recombinase XerD